MRSRAGLGRAWVWWEGVSGSLRGAVVWLGGRGSLGERGRGK